MADSMAALGNFKGVMLCNRPAQIPGSLQTIVGPTATSGPTRPAFVSAVVPDAQLGLPPVRQQRVQARVDPAASRENDVTWRHKKWLTEFSEHRAAVAGSLEQRVAEQADRQKRFAERNKAMRDTIRGIKSDASGDKDAKAAAIEAALGSSTRPRFVPTEYVDVSQQYPRGAPITHYDDNTSSNAQASPLAASSAQPDSSRKSAAVAPKSKASGVSKPGWAQTSSEADDFLDVEADQLLDFANGLDYQTYIDDLEVREAIKFVQQRVDGLEKDKQTAQTREETERKLIAAGELEELWVVDESQPADELTGEPAMKRVVRRPRAKARQALNMVGAEGEGGEDAQFNGGMDSEREAAAAQEALARAALDSNRHLRNIHSSASVRAIMDKEQSTAAPKQSPTSLRAAAPAAGGSNTLRRTQLASIPDEQSAAMRPPVITTVRVGEHGPKPTHPSNLPFLYRHPGI